MIIAKNSFFKLQLVASVFITLTTTFLFNSIDYQGMFSLCAFIGLIGKIQDCNLKPRSSAFFSLQCCFYSFFWQKLMCLNNSHIFFILGIVATIKFKPTTSSESRRNSYEEIWSITQISHSCYLPNTNPVHKSQRK